MKERLAIIDHGAHVLYIEDIDTDVLDLFYGGEEEQYIESHYHFDSGYSWDYIVDTQYVPESSEPIDLELEKWIV